MEVETEEKEGKTEGRGKTREIRVPLERILTANMSAPKISQHLLGWESRPDLSEELTDCQVHLGGFQRQRVINKTRRRPTGFR